MTKAYSLLFYALHENWTRWDQEPNTVYVFFLLFLGRVCLSPFSHAVSRSFFHVALHVYAIILLKHVVCRLACRRITRSETVCADACVLARTRLSNVVRTFFYVLRITHSHNDCNNNIEKSHSPILATNYSFYSFLFCSLKSKYMVHE